MAQLFIEIHTLIFRGRLGWVIGLYSTIGILFPDLISPGMSFELAAADGWTSIS